MQHTLKASWRCGNDNTICRFPVYTFPQCEKFCTVGAVARAVQIENENSSKCLADDSKTGPEAFPMTCCNMNDPLFWHKGQQVIKNIFRTSKNQGFVFNWLVGLNQTSKSEIFFNENKTPQETPMNWKTLLALLKNICRKQLKKILEGRVLLLGGNLHKTCNLKNVFYKAEYEYKTVCLYTYNTFILLINRLMRHINFQVRSLRRYLVPKREILYNK